MATIYFFQALFYRLRARSTRLIDICRDAKIGAPGRSDNPTWNLVGASLIIHSIGEALALGVDAHILWAVGRLAIRDGDCVTVWLACAHRTSIQVGPIALPFRLWKEVFFEFLVS